MLKIISKCLVVILSLLRNHILAKSYFDCPLIGEQTSGQGQDVNESVRCKKFKRYDRFGQYSRFLENSGINISAYSKQNIPIYEKQKKILLQLTDMFNLRNNIIKDENVKVSGGTAFKKIDYKEKLSKIDATDYAQQSTLGNQLFHIGENYMSVSPKGKINLWVTQKSKMTKHQNLEYQCNGDARHIFTRQSFLVSDTLTLCHTSKEDKITKFELVHVYAGINFIRNSVEFEWKEEGQKDQIDATLFNSFLSFPFGTLKEHGVVYLTFENKPQDGRLRGIIFGMTEDNSKVKTMSKIDMNFASEQLKFRTIIQSELFPVSESYPKVNSHLMLLSPANGSSKSPFLMKFLKLQFNQENGEIELKLGEEMKEESFNTENTISYGHAGYNKLYYINKIIDQSQNIKYQITICNIGNNTGKQTDVQCLKSAIAMSMIQAGDEILTLMSDDSTSPSRFVILLKNSNASEKYRVSVEDKNYRGVFIAKNAQKIDIVKSSFSSKVGVFIKGQKSELGIYEPWVKMARLEVDFEKYTGNEKVEVSSDGRNWVSQDISFKRYSSLTDTQKIVSINNQDIQIFENWFTSPQMLIPMAKKIAFQGNMLSRPQLIQEKIKNQKIKIDFLDSGRVKNTINGRIKITKDMRIYNSTIIIPKLARVNGLNSMFGVFTNCSLTEKSNLQNIECMQEAKFPLKKSGRVGSVSFVKNKMINFTGLMMEHMHKDGIDLIIYGRYNNKKFGIFYLQYSMSISKEQQSIEKQFVTKLGMRGEMTSTYVKCDIKGNTCDFYDLELKIVSVYDPKTKQMTFTLKIVANRVALVKLEENLIFNGFSVVDIQILKGYSEGYLVMKDSNNNPKIVSFSYFQENSVKFMDLQIPLQGTNHKLGTTFDFCSETNPVVYETFKNKTSQKMMSKVQILVNQKDKTWQSLFIQNFGIQEVVSIKCIGVEVILQGYASTQSKKVREISILVYNLHDLLLKNETQLDSTLNVMNGLKLKKEIELPQNQNQLNIDFIGLSTEMPKRRIQSENSTLLFWDDDKETFQYIPTFNNPTVLIKKLKGQNEFTNGLIQDSSFSMKFDSQHSETITMNLNYTFYKNPSMSGKTPIFEKIEKAQKLKGKISLKDSASYKLEDLVSLPPEKKPSVVMIDYIGGNKYFVTNNPKMPTVKSSISLKTKDLFEGEKFAGICPRGKAKISIPWVNEMRYNTKMKMIFEGKDYVTEICPHQEKLYNSTSKKVHLVNIYSCSAYSIEKDGQQLAVGITKGLFKEIQHDVKKKNIYYKGVTFMMIDSNGMKVLSAVPLDYYIYLDQKENQEPLDLSAYFDQRKITIILNPKAQKGKEFDQIYIARTYRKKLLIYKLIRKEKKFQKVSTVPSPSKSTSWQICRSGFGHLIMLSQNSASKEVFVRRFNSATEQIDLSQKYNFPFNKRIHHLRCKSDMKGEQLEILFYLGLGNNYLITLELSAQKIIDSEQFFLPGNKPVNFWPNMPPTVDWNSNYIIKNAQSESLASTREWNKKLGKIRYGYFSKKGFWIWKRKNKTPTPIAEIYYPINFIDFYLTSQGLIHTTNYDDYCHSQEFILNKNPSHTLEIHEAYTLADLMSKTSLKIYFDDGSVGKIPMTHLFKYSPFWKQVTVACIGIAVVLLICLFRAWRTKRKQHVKCFKGIKSVAQKELDESMIGLNSAETESRSSVFSKLSQVSENDSNFHLNHNL